MELGTWGIIKEAPSLLALIPMVMYIIMAFNEKISQFVNIMICVIVGCILTGNGIKEFGAAFAGATDSTIGIIGLIIALGTGVGAVMTLTGVNKTLCKWIVDGIGVNTKSKALIACEICAVVVCGLLGTLAGGCAIIAPVLIPVVAAVGLTPNAVGCVLQSAGETGLIWGPFSGPVVTLCALTGLTYGQQMLWAALPYGIVWLIVVYFSGVYVQKKTEGKYGYELTEEDKMTNDISPKEKRTALAFIVVFIALVVYAIITKQGMNYVIPVMLLLALVMIVASGTNLDKGVKVFLKGVSSAGGMWVLFISLELLMNVITAGGGFDALGNLFLKLTGEPTMTSTMIIGTLVGSFGINGGAVAQLTVTHEMFLPSIEACGLPMELWAVALICGSRATSSMYPGSNMIAVMGTARSDDLKAMLIGGWAVSLVSIVMIMVWAFVGPMFF